MSQTPAFTASSGDAKTSGYHGLGRLGRQLPRVNSNIREMADRPRMTSAPPSDAYRNLLHARHPQSDDTVLHVKGPPGSHPYNPRRGIRQNGQIRNCALPPFRNGREKVRMKLHVPSWRVIWTVPITLWGTMWTASWSVSSDRLFQMSRYGILLGSSSTSPTTQAGRSGTRSQFTLRPKKRPPALCLTRVPRLTINSP
jgi:hypothetical protein